MGLIIKSIQMGFLITSLLASWAQAELICPPLQGTYICYEKPQNAEGVMVQTVVAGHTVYQWTEAGQTTTITADGLWHDLPTEPNDPPNTSRKNRNLCFGGQRLNISFTTETMNSFRQITKSESIDQVLSYLPDGMRVETRIFTNGSQTSSTRFFCKRLSRGPGSVFRKY